jgi:ABC-type branched-subunit amino acid transport system ATPase component
MSQWGADLNGDGTVKEWYEQADAFNAATIGKTAGEITSLLGDNGYGNADLQTAGCTIAVSALVKAAAKIG